MPPRVFGFDPIVGESPKILILGTFPSQSSIKAKEYYANPQNQFWPIIARIFNNGESFYYYQAGVRCLLNNHIAVWDVYHSKDDTGDSRNENITNPEANDIAGFLAEHPTIKRVVFNGNDDSLYKECIVRQHIPFEMCKWARQTSWRYSKTVKVCLPSWQSALTDF